ncbi:uncharacterized protein LOC122264992 isoform X2 [Penaeus japonicus]|uniref:uncharacterized protein LOC122264992 isoform X2 n=1 Tax=Penaeus japonicus TaxID=27405 RepID=UPI001C70CBC4|nr:uncharacterized protein LOC122264992 isoform X2 [Penaeus japonicus]
MDTDVMYSLKSGRLGRIVVTSLLAVVLVYTLVFNGLAGPGLPPFTQSTGNISDLLFTCVTPAGYTFSIWGVIYFALVAILIYAISLLFRKVGDDDAWKLGGSVSIPFMIVFIINLNLNVGWLFAWDAVNATGSAILLLLIAITNAIAISLSSVSFGKVASDLYQNSKLDFWAGVCVLNGYDIYDTWTTLAALINLTAFFTYETDVNGNSVCIGVLVFVLVAYSGYFILENTFLAFWGNPCFTHYIVLLWAMIGIHTEQKDKASTEVIALIITLIAASAVMLVARLIILVLRNRKNTFYKRSIM